jgi:hypothetical protein
LVFHFMNSAGHLAEHFALLFEDSLNDSSCASRRARLPWEVFRELMQRALGPLARKRRDPGAFWRGLRLLAMDGTQFSVTNTPQVKRTQRKAKSRRGQAAFAKITTGVLLEVGLHNPLAAAMGQQGQSEWQLALSLLAQLPKGGPAVGGSFARVLGLCLPRPVRVSTSGESFSDSGSESDQGPDRAQA